MQITNSRPCGCGRSPTGQCIGWHNLTETEWIEGKTQLVHNLTSGHGKVIDDTSDGWDNLGDE